MAGAYAVGQWEERVTKIEFEGVAETQAIIMQNGMNEYVSRLVALRTLFESANEEITRSEFETFSGRLFEQHPGIRRIAWLPRINRKERPEYEASAISDGVSGYQIKSLVGDGGIAAAPQSDEYYPVFFSTEHGVPVKTSRNERRSPSAGRAGLRTGLRKGNFARRDRRPAA